jgi:hypothetical protein
MKNVFFLLMLMASFTISCGNTAASNTSKENADSAASTVKEDPKPDPKSDDTTIEGFWAMFKKAVASGNMANIEALIHFGALTKADIESTGEIYFQDKEALAFIAKSTTEDLKPNDSTFDGITVEDVHQYTINFNTTVDGDTYESALMYFVAKVGGKYRLVYLAAAG